MTNNNLDDIFDADSLLSLLNEIQTNAEAINDNLNDNSKKKRNGFYPGMIKIAASALSSELDDNDEWIDDIIDDMNKIPTRETHLKPIRAYNFNDYSPEIYSDQQLSEIKKGIDHKVHVDEYADPEMSARQMREVRYGLERGLDVKYYNNKLFRERQMKEIRIGLQEGIDVEKYAKIIYSATDMHKKRIQLFAEKYVDKLDDLSYDYDDIDTGIHIYVEPGLMEAGIVINSKLPEKFTKDNLKNLLAEYDITEGFNEKLLPQNLSNLPKGVKISVMFGKPASKGKDGYYKYEFPIDESSKPRIMEDGTVDYTPAKTYKAVKRGDIIIRYQLAEIGKDGITVTGIEIKGNYGNNLEVLKSEDLIVSRDKSYYMSKKEGFITLVNGNVRIMDNLIFNEDLTNSNGKVSFDGTVQVNGSVRERAQIVATGNIIVSGYVESATFVAGGDIIIAGGVNADESGSYVAKGNITAGFFENAVVDAGGNVECGYILNSNIVAGGFVKTKGKKSLICGGTISGREGIYAGTIGSSAGTKTEIIVGGCDENMDEYLKLVDIRRKLDEEISKIHSVMDTMVQKLGILQVRRDESYCKLQSTVETKKTSREAISKEIKIIEDKRLSKNNVRLEVYHEIFENILININGNKMVTKEAVEKPVFKNLGRRIIIEKS